MATPSVVTVAPSMGFILIPSGVIFLYILYLYLLPHPIPGIPHNPAAAGSLLGDIPSLLRDAKGSPMDWMIAQTRSHAGPVCQIFIRPFGKPFVLLSDFREAQDIMMRRKEWDRSDWSIDILRGIAPQHHINMKMGTAWKAHRRLLQDLMTPKFLNKVAAPNIYESVLGLAQLWKIKARVADNRPFEATGDVFHAALDAVLEFSFGKSFAHRAVPPQMEGVLMLEKQGVANVVDEGPLDFGTAPLHETLRATLHSGETVGDVLDSPFPRLSWWWKSIQPSERTFARIREEYIKEQVMKAVGRLNSEKDTSDDAWVMSAVDLMMDREQQFARKENREPMYWSAAVRDEVLGFVIAGHDTTSTTLLWGLKLLTDSQSTQNTLRAALHASHAAAFAQGRMPSVEEISHTTIPYLDAVTEEILRCAGTISIIDRQCTQDTTLLGHHIPKGTTVLMANRGHSFTEPGFIVDEKQRSPSSQAAARERGVRRWEAEGMDAFSPERWLVKDEKTGEMVYDSTAGPTMPFGLGMRGCFGRKLAYIELRIFITLIVWNFELMKCAEGLSGYDAVDELTHKPRQCFVKLSNNMP